jgi:hypothetical protein
MWGGGVSLFVNRGRSLNALEGQGERHVCATVHPVGGKVKSVSGLRDADAEPLLGIRETQPTILAHERAVDVVDFLGALAVGETRVQDRHSAAVYDEANLPPERKV